MGWISAARYASMRHPHAKLGALRKPRGRSIMTDTFDYIIVGAGSAGCILANRLTADVRHSVCLLETGPPDWHPNIHTTTSLLKALNNQPTNWLYESEP